METTQSTVLHFRLQSGYANALQHNVIRTLPISDLKETDFPFVEPRQRWAKDVDVLHGDGCSVSVTLVVLLDYLTAVYRLHKLFLCMM